jgi:hypothetical protein
MVPSLFVHIVLWPRYISKLVNLSYTEVVYKVWAPVFLSSIPFAIATYAVNVFFPAHSLVVFIAQVIALLPVFIISIGLVFRTYVSNQLVPRIRSRFSVEAKV